MVSLLQEPHGEPAYGYLLPMRLGHLSGLLKENVFEVGRESVLLVVIGHWFHPP